MRVAIVFIILLGSSFASAQSRRSSDLPDEYNVIVERNMFLRERQRPREPSTQPTTTQRVETPPDVPERRIVLRGIVIEEGGFRAYLEDTRGGVTRVSPGDAIATGHITDIAIDAVAYTWPDGEVKWVEIGQNLEGVRQSAPASTASAPASDPSASGSGSAATPAAPGGTPNSANLSLEERMRLRRQQGR